MSRKILIASEGYIFTNGKSFGREIYLAEDENDENFYEITEEEYDEIQRQNIPEHIDPIGGEFNVI